MSATVEVAPGTGRAEERAGIGRLDNNALIIRLHFTVNHLSRWLTPIHDQTKLLRAPRRSDPSAKDLLLAMRDEELRSFPKLHLISVQTQPDLDQLPPFARTAAQAEQDRRVSPLGVMAEFRRLRQSTCSLLRTLPDSAWLRDGISRREHDWTIRELAEHLAWHDVRHLRAMDLALDRSGAREGLAPIQRVGLDELLKLGPTSMSRPE